MMVYRFERQDNEIKYVAMAVLHEAQTAELVSEGRVTNFYEPRACIGSKPATCRF